MAVALKTMIESEPSSRGLHMKSREFQATVRCLLKETGMWILRSCCSINGPWKTPTH